MHEVEPQVSAIVLSYNTREITLECLRSLIAGLEGIDAEIFVVDNASSDGSVAAIAHSFPNVNLIANDRNLGFGAANNQAMREASGEYLLLLNSDAFPEPDAIGHMVEYLRINVEVGAVGPRLLNGDGSLQISCFPFPSPGRAWLENLWLSKAFPHTTRFGDYRKWAHDSERHVDWVVGACLILRRAVYEEIGGFDERFFMYAEESDWQRRMRDAGWEIGFTPNAVVRHLGGASGVTNRPETNQHFFQSLDVYELKHHGRWGLLALRAAMVIGILMRLPLWACVHALVPPKRALAAGKIRLLSWLLLRQFTHWAFA